MTSLSHVHYKGVSYGQYHAGIGRKMSSSQSPATSQPINHSINQINQSINQSISECFYPTKQLDDGAGCCWSLTAAGDRPISSEATRKIRHSACWDKDNGAMLATTTANNTVMECTPIWTHCFARLHQKPQGEYSVIFPSNSGGGGEEEEEEKKNNF